MPTYQQNTITTARGVKAVADHAGSYFFTPATMRAFSSRLLSGVRALDGRETVPGARFLFVTSERHGDDQPRHYALRMMTLGVQRDDRPAVDIVTVGEYHTTAARARAAMRDYVPADSMEA